METEYVMMSKKEHWELSSELLEANRAESDNGGQRDSAVGSEIAFPSAHPALICSTTFGPLFLIKSDLWLQSQE